MKFETLACERIGDVLKVALNRPAKLNSLSIGLIHDLRDCAEAIQRDRSVRAVLLTGEGRAFCAGADLTDPGAVPPPGKLLGQFTVGRLRHDFNPVALLWTQLPVPGDLYCTPIGFPGPERLGMKPFLIASLHSATLRFFSKPSDG